MANDVSTTWRLTATKPCTLDNTYDKDASGNLIGSLKVFAVGEEAICTQEQYTALWKNGLIVGATTESSDACWTASVDGQTGGGSGGGDVSSVKASDKSLVIAPTVGDVRASVAISADAGNALSLHSDGLFAQAGGGGGGGAVDSVSAKDNTMTVQPTVGDVQVAVKVSPDANNVLQATANGLKVTAAAVSGGVADVVDPNGTSLVKDNGVAALIEFDESKLPPVVPNPAFFGAFGTIQDMFDSSTEEDLLDAADKRKWFANKTNSKTGTFGYMESSAAVLTATQTIVHTIEFDGKASSTVGQPLVNAKLFYLGEFSDADCSFKQLGGTANTIAVKIGRDAAGHYDVDITNADGTVGIARLITSSVSVPNALFEHNNIRLRWTKNGASTGELQFIGLCVNPSSTIPDAGFRDVYSWAGVIDGVSYDGGVVDDATHKMEIGAGGVYGLFSKRLYDKLSTGSGGGGIDDAPSDGTLYGRRNGTWKEVPTDVVPEAPADGKLYARSQKTWQAFVLNEGIKELTSANAAITVAGNDSEKELTFKVSGRTDNQAQITSDGLYVPASSAPAPQLNVTKKNVYQLVYAIAGASAVSGDGAFSGVVSFQYVGDTKPATPANFTELSALIKQVSPIDGTAPASGTWHTTSGSTTSASNICGVFAANVGCEILIAQDGGQPPVTRSAAATPASIEDFSFLVNTVVTDVTFGSTAKAEDDAITKTVEGTINVDNGTCSFGGLIVKDGAEIGDVNSLVAAIVKSDECVVKATIEKKKYTSCYVKNGKLILVGVDTEFECLGTWFVSVK